MSSENFDSIFRNKLEEIQPEYHPSVWTRIQSKMSVSPFSFGIKNAAPLAYGTVTTIMLFWMAFQIQDLKTETIRLNDSVRRSEEILQLSKLALDEIRSSKVDTVFLTSSRMSSRKNLKQSGNNGVNHHSYSDVPGSFNDPTSGLAASQQQILSNIQFGNRITNRKSTSSLTKSNVVRLKDAVSGEAESVPLFMPNSTDQRTVSDKNQSFSSFPLSNASLKDTVASVIDSVLNAKNLTEPAKPETAAIDSAVQKKENTEKTKSRNSFRFSDLNARVGLGVTMASPNFIGFGPDFEIRVSQHLGLSIGLTAYSSTKREFENQEEFNFSTGYTFHSAYKNAVSADETGIHDIRVESSNIEVPIRLKYYTPVSGSCNIIFSAGTHFNISNVDKVRYEAINGYNERYRTFTHNSQSSVFHNFILGVGIERKGRKVHWQLLPYYTYNFRQQGIYEDKKIFGLTLTAWLPLSQNESSK
jgi:hypothetical protein